MRILDYALTRPSVDPDNAAVIGHSRLGRTALLTGMLDTRFKYVISNNSGCLGASLHRGNTWHARAISGVKCGEVITDSIAKFPYWYCKSTEKPIYPTCLISTFYLRR